MSFRYNLEPNAVDSHQADPYWFGVIVRFKHVRTFDRSTIIQRAGDQEMNVSLKVADANPVTEREALVLTNQIVAFNVNYGKGSHTASATFRVVPGRFQFEAQTQAGDWVMFWAFDNQEDYERVLNKAIVVLKTGSGEAPNSFFDGLKFVGRLNAPRRARGVDPTTGAPRKEYRLTAVGFGEFDAKVYYNQAHQAKYQELINGFVAQVSDLVANHGSGSKVDENIGLPLTTAQHAQIWLETFLGAGPGAASKGFDPSLIAGTAFGKEDEETGALLQSPNDIFLVPTSVGRLLGVNTAFDQPLRYIDLLNTFIGVQGPSDRISTHRTEASSDDLAAIGFCPIKLGDPSGTFRAQYMNFGLTTVWDIISGFSNQPLNEMFVTLRVGANGKVKPTFMLRQNVMSSKPCVDALEQRGWAMTSFLDVPRWVVDPVLVKGEDLGPSDSMRINYVHVQGTDVVGDHAINLQTANTVLSPPMGDVADIKRSGVRPFIATLNSDITGLLEARGQLGRAYTQFMADILMDQHLKWNGTLQLHGIQEPITIGDNLEYDGVIYHIEAMTVSGHIDTSNGKKTFETTCQLSNGVSVASDDAADTVMPYETVAADTTISHESRTTTAEATVDPSALFEPETARVEELLARDPLAARGFFGSEKLF